MSTNIHFTAGGGTISRALTGTGGGTPGDVYRYGGNAFPNQTFNGNNYWVDVVFTTSP